MPYGIHALIIDCCRKRNMQQAQNYFDRLGKVRNIMVYNKMIEGHCMQGNIEKAEFLLNKMINENVPTPPHVYIEIIQYYLKNGDNERAYSYLREMKNKFKNPKHLFTVHKMFKGFFRLNLVDEIEPYFDDVKDRVTFTTETFNILIDIYFRKNDIVKAEKIFERMKEFNVSPDQTSYDLMIRGFSLTRNLAKAEALLRQAIEEKKNIKIDSFNSLINAYCKTKYVEKAEEILDLIIQADKKPNADSFNPLIRKYCKFDIDRAEEFFHRMLNQQINPDEITYISLILGFCKNLKLHNAESIADMMLNDKRIRYPDIKVLTTLVKAYCASHDMERAQAVFDKILARNIQPDAMLFSTVIIGHCFVQNTQKVKDLLVLMAHYKIGITTAIKTTLKRFNIKLWE